MGNIGEYPLEDWRTRMTPLYYDLTALQLQYEADKGWKRIRVSTDELGAMGADESFLSSRRRVIVSGHMITDVRGHVRWLDDEVWPMSDGEYVRRYLHYCWGVAHAGKPTTRGTDSTAIVPPPIFRAFDSPVTAGVVKVDIHAAFFSLYSPLGVEPVYRGVVLEKDEAVPFVRADEFGWCKPARNTLISQLAHRSYDYFQYGELKTEYSEIDAITYRPEMVRYVYDVLHQIAHETCEQWQVLTWNTDGGVLVGDDATGREWVEWLAKRWGLDGRVDKAGTATVYNHFIVGWEDGDTLPPDDPGFAARTDTILAPGSWLAPLTRIAQRGRPALDVAPVEPPAWWVELRKADVIGGRSDWTVPAGESLTVDLAGATTALATRTDPTWCPRCGGPAPSIVRITRKVSKCGKCATKLGKRFVTEYDTKTWQPELFPPKGHEGCTVEIVEMPRTVPHPRIKGKLITYGVAWWRHRELSGSAIHGGRSEHLRLSAGDRLAVGYKYVEGRTFGTDREDWALMVTGKPDDVAVLTDTHDIGIVIHVTGARLA